MQIPSLQPVLKNWRTTLGGILSAIPPVVVAAGFVLTPNEQHWLALCQGVGALLLGLAAKDSATHSTESEIAQATQADNATRPPAGMADGVKK